jgi:uncharacterized protein (TIGR03437 family)
MFVSPTQINVQAPDDTATGTVPVVVTTALGSATSSVTLNQFAPSFSVIETSNGVQFVSGIILRTNGSGAFGNGTYDILGPAGTSLGYKTVPAMPGDIVELFAVGLGPTSPPVLAGQAFSGQAPLRNPITLYINNIAVSPGFVGISSAGLYQINLTVPTGLGEGEVPIMAIAGGMQTQDSVWFSLAAYQAGGGYGGTTGPIASGGPGMGFTSGLPGCCGTGGGTFGGGGDSGGGSGGSARRAKKPYEPRLHFPPR